MQWAFTDEQQMYAAALGEWLDSTVPSTRLRTWLDEGDTAAMWQAYVNDGWAGVGLPETAGGQGGGIVELALTAERFGYVAAPDSTWLSTVVASAALGPEALSRALAGGGAALLMDANRLPVEAIALEIDAKGRVSGTVPRVLGAVGADVLVAVVQSDTGRSLRLVEPGADGMTVRPQALLDGTRTVASVDLDGVESADLSGDPDDVLARATDLAGVLVAADALGIAQRVLDMSVAYAGQRHQFGVPIGSFQAVKHAAATMEVGVESGRSAIFYAAASVEAGVPEAALQAAAVKSQVGDETAVAVDTALTLHGAIGYTWEHDLQLFYKRAKLDARMFGSSNGWLGRIADNLLHV